MECVILYFCGLLVGWLAYWYALPARWRYRGMTYRRQLLERSERQWGRYLQWYNRHEKNPDEEKEGQP